MRLICIAILLAGAALFSSASRADTAATGTVSYNRDIRPVLSDHCYACHGPDQKERKGGLRLDRKEDAFAALKSGKRAIVAGDLDHSELVRRINSTDPDEVMPPKEGKPLNAAQAALLKRWVAEGAVWQSHWAYQKPERPALPSVKNAAWPKNDVDRFILSKLEEKSLQPAPEAGKETLIRRVTLDLTGLPPTVEQLDAFLADSSSDAYEKVVDRLLESKQYGEQQAMRWLDLARYGETQGFHHDAHRDMFHWRDWVIDAFNRNMPFDQFTIEQLAGDLLPHPTREQRVATGFHRNEMTTSEGGALPEEYSVKYVVGRVDTTARVWLGTSMACAECHDHKYDPISQRDYYRFFAYFNTISENGLDREMNPVPRLALSTPEQEKQLQDFDHQTDALAAAQKSVLESPNPPADAALAEWQRRIRERVIENWLVVRPALAVSTNGAALTAGADGTIKVSGERPEQDRYDVTFHSGAGTLTGLRLETLPDEGAPENRAGRGPNGEFILTRLEADYRKIPSSNSVFRVSPAGWRAVGPFSAESTAAAVAAASGPESNLDLEAVYGGAQLKWSAAQTNETGGVRIPPGTGAGATYFFNSIRAAESGPAILDLKSSGSIQVWLNWKKIFSSTEGSAKSDPVKVRLEAGDNRLLIKVAHGKEAGDLAVRVIDPAESWQPAGIAQAAADFNPAGYGVAGVLDQKVVTGWSNAGSAAGKTQRAWFRFKEPIGFAAAETEVRVRLYFNAPKSFMTLAKFRLAASRSDSLAEWFALPERVRGILASAEPLVAAEKFEVQRYYRETFLAEAKELTQLLDAKGKERENFRNAIPVAMVMQEMEKPRDTFLLVRGEYNRPGDKVTVGVPSAVFPAPDGLPANRLGLAKWLVHPDHPLTSRVVVNQYWQQFFGTGLVKTSEDFGSQGEFPSHPQLLDWLATEFIRTGWNVKKMQRLLVTSATYRQSSAIRQEAMEADPEDRLLSRFPRLRLPAENIRDQALAVSGLLNPKLGGPSVYPYQPPGLWEQVAFEGTRSWVQSQGDENYRRGLYVYWRRSIPYASFVIFDAPSREVCTVRRPRTNTPLQALVLMNDPVYVETARAFGQRILKHPGDVPEKLRFAFRACLARTPRAEEMERLAKAFEKEFEQFQLDRPAANQLIHVGASSPAVDVDICELAAWTFIANIIFNLDETVTKG